ncbi:MaoC family dehydratase [Aureimonas frigidaquae]|uniref:Acyl dehydratase n=1 Tax=Aureimonas frigidaquae TaxID=424757 RepID=A0A0P0Z397_9HYPH|nr:MaoC/PaaZ C-terminal domain-containing protein [Aureimonas frigidaquae]BAT28589.1 acyl dehydratase [Aureimonas frigidaquae]
MSQIKYFDAFRIGDVRMSASRTITESDIVTHAGHTGDFFPHHVDAEFAAQTPFGQRIAHGTMIFAIGIGLAAGEINPASFSYGHDRLRFVRPVMIGDTIRTRITVVAKEDDPKRPQCGRVTERCEVLNQRGETVLVSDHIRIVERAA